LRRQAARLQTLADASAAFSEAVPDDERLLETVARLTATSSGDGCTVRLLADDGERFDVDDLIRVVNRSCVME